MGNRLYVGNLSYQTTEDSFRVAFSAFGDVVDVHIPTDRETGQPRGFAFVTMGNDEQAAKAIAEMNGAMLDGRALRVNEAEERRGGRRRRRRWWWWWRPRWRRRKGRPLVSAGEPRRALLKAAAVELGRRWADAWREDLGRDGRAVEGGWPGTLREARARVTAHAGSIPGPLTAEELGWAARATYDEARRAWLASVVRRASQER